MPVSDRKYREVEARASVAVDLLIRIFQHINDGSIVTIKGPALGTIQRLKNFIKDDR